MLVYFKTLLFHFSTLRGAQGRPEQGNKNNQVIKTNHKAKHDQGANKTKPKYNALIKSPMKQNSI